MNTQRCGNPGDIFPILPGGSLQGLVSCRLTMRLAAFVLALAIWLQAYLGWMTASAVEVYKWIFDLEQEISKSTNKDVDADIVNIANWELHHGIAFVAPSKNDSFQDYLTIQKHWKTNHGVEM